MVDADRKPDLTDLVSEGSPTRFAIRTWLEDHRDELAQDILQWIAVPSVSDPSAAEPGAPYGKAVAKMFDVVRLAAEELDLRWEDHGGHVVSVLWGAASEEIGIVTHVDVVPAGDGWTTPPFSPRYVAPYVIGRGACDNKGPAVGTLYLVRMLRDLGVSLQHRVRLMFGGAEEIGMPDLRAYLADGHPVPVRSIVADGMFPVNIAQKGMLTCLVRIPAGTDRFRSLKAGLVANAVPASATIQLNSGCPMPRPHDRLTVDGDATDALLTASGRPGHAAFPEGTLNAAAVLVEALLASTAWEERDESALRTLLALSSSPYGDGIGLALTDDLTGALTANAGIVTGSADGIDVVLDVRYPASYRGDEITSRLTEWCAAQGATVQDVRDSSPSVIDPDDAIVSLLSDTYAEISGRNDEPYSMGGGTHSRVLPHSVTFGPGAHDLGPSRPPAGIVSDSAGAHGPDEWLHMDDLLDALEIYAIALIRMDAHLSA
ncbi:Sapep family Mn(2+)-dependent dipeptidase [Microbacterium sp. A93]|uniref:Sapep family Mn(2+)-dependent dipeptidase n=1 Tax=Microbacterium sp. A93 TaxID=3450716 RepID=UPI003F430CB6